MSLRRYFPPTTVHATDGRGSSINYLTLSQIADGLPPSWSGKRVHVSTITRYILKGARLRDGSWLRLRGTRLPGRWVVEPEAVGEFIAALTADRSTGPDAAGTAGATASESGPASASTVGTRRKADERAARELDRLGIR